jgi:Asp-tRNA(Asn)/Glu-tRNA(Gln) amidotransferase C subunit
MRKFEKKINELNLVKGKLSKALNSNIKDFEMLEQSLVGLHAELREAEAKENNEEEVEKLAQESEELEEQLENFDGVLTEKVQTYADNYDSYQERIRKMDEGRKAKSAAKAQQAAPVEAAPAPQSAPTPEPIVEPAPQAAAPPPPPAPKQEEKEEKGTNWLLWGVLGVAGIFVGINLFKNKR